MPYDKTKDPTRTFPPMSSKWTAPRTRGFSITPADGVDLAEYAMSLNVITAGNIAIVPLYQADDTPIVIYAPAGDVPWAVRRVHATNTTAAGITGGIVS